MDEQDHGLSARRGPDRLTSSRAPARPGRGDEARLERLSAYLDGWATDRERVAVERELTSDSAARELLEDLRLVRMALADLSTPRAPRSFALMVAPPRRSPAALFRRLEWATRGAAGVAALAFAVALIRAPQVSETVTSAAPARTQESAVAAAPVETPSPAGARETDAQTLDAVPPADAPADTATAAPAAASTPATAAATPGAATGPAASAPAPPVAPTSAGAQTPTPAAPTLLLAPPSTATPSAPASGSPPTPAATVEATRFAAAPAPTSTELAPAAAATKPTAAPTPDVPTAKRTDEAIAPAPAVTPALVPASGPASGPVPGTVLPVATSEDSGEADIAPALGVLAVLLALLALVERAEARVKRA